MHAAACWATEGVVRYLLEKGADKSISNKVLLFASAPWQHQPTQNIQLGKTPLDLADEFGRSANATQLRNWNVILYKTGKDRPG